MENKIVRLAGRKSAAADQNKTILDRMRGVPAQRDTPEADADPRNPSLRKVRCEDAERELRPPRPTP